MRGIEDIRRYLAQPGRTQPSHIVIASLTEQPAIKYSGDLTDFLRQELRAIALDRKFAMFQIGDMDFCFLSTDERTRLYGSISEIRAAILRGLDQFMPGSFGTFDQSRLVQSFDLTVLKESAVAVIEAHLGKMERRGGGGTRPPPPRLGYEHLEKLDAARTKLGPAKLAALIVRRQNAYIVNARTATTPAFGEFYCCTEALRREVIGEVDFRQSRQLFSLLTVIFDRLVLAAFPLLNPERDRCALNLNIETIFTPDFEAFSKEQMGNDLSRLVVELKANDILQNFDEFLVARDVLTSRGAVLAVDALFPKMLGLLDLGALGIKVAKIFATEDSFTQLLSRRVELADLQQAGVALVLARTQDERMHRVGHEVGIRMFQGFYIDRLAGEGPGLMKG